MRKAANHDDAGADSPGQPRQTTGEANEEFGVLEPASAFLQRETGLVLHAVRNVVPEKINAVHGLLVDAYNLVSRFFEATMISRQPLGLFQYFAWVVLWVAMHT